jgi:hypothetical protein
MVELRPGSGRRSFGLALAASLSVCIMNQNLKESLQNGNCIQLTADVISGITYCTLEEQNIYHTLNIEICTTGII